MAHELGFNPFSTHTVHGPSTNPFAEPGPEAAPPPAYGNQTHQSPHGLTSREPQPGGGMPPRQPTNFGGGHSPAPIGPDEATMHALMMQRQQTINNNALSEATIESMENQGTNKFMESMAELKAKNLKSAGEKLAGLA